jgi:hypothetical protein
VHGATDRQISLPAGYYAEFSFIAGLLRFVVSFAVAPDTSPLSGRK